VKPRGGHSLTEVSTNLVQWTKIGVRTNLTGTVDFIDLAATRLWRRDGSVWTNTSSGASWNARSAVYQATYASALRIRRIHGQCETRSQFNIEVLGLLLQEESDLTASACRFVSGSLAAVFLTQADSLSSNRLLPG
jgi:hypothetical protein